MGDRIKLALGGSEGRMGEVIKRLAKKADDIEVVNIIDPKLSGFYSGGASVSLDDKCRGADVYIDFTDPDAVLDNIKAASEMGLNSVIGTTGWYEGLDEMERIANGNGRIVVYAPNFSLGVNVLFNVVEYMTRALGPEGFDIGVDEVHHTGKKDAPSGTAVEFAKIITREHPDKTSLSYGSTGKMDVDEVSIGAKRVGSVPGKHRITFSPKLESGDYEEIEIMHRANTRDTFGMGALAAARWVYKAGKEGREPGLYTFRKDVLGGL